MRAHSSPLCPSCETRSQEAQEEVQMATSQQHSCTHPHPPWAPHSHPHPQPPFSAPGLLQQDGGRAQADDRDRGGAVGRLARLCLRCLWPGVRGLAGEAGRAGGWADGRARRMQLGGTSVGASTVKASNFPPGVRLRQGTSLVLAASGGVRGAAQAARPRPREREARARQIKTAAAALPGQGRWEGRRAHTEPVGAGRRCAPRTRASRTGAY